MKWSRIALLALGAAVVALLVAGGTFSLLALTVFAIAGIFVDRIAPQHPFVNALGYGLLGVSFYVTLLVLQALGEGQTDLTAADVFLGLALPVAVVVVPQSLIGVWIGRTIRKFSQVAAAARQERDAPPDQKTTPPAAAAPPPSAKKPAAGRRKKG